ncbi:MAG: family 20 glycosylhydrolase, partial [Rikenella sp.]|nr:family 20 glycosylhydrolase [Rikenella sp.]
PMAARHATPARRQPPQLVRIEEGDTLYGGYYTQDEIRDVVAYASARGIDIVPELDMPGHLMGAQQGYPWITCTGESSWGKSFSSPLCPGKDSSLMFAKNVYSEVFNLFPYEYVHLGADEVEKTNWKACPDCQARMKTYELNNEEELQAWFVHDMENHFNANGKKMIGWDEIVDGGLSPTATITWWRDWAPKAVTKATAQGNDVIICPDFLLYLDFIEQGRDLRRIYDTEPTAYRDDWRLTPKQARHIRGVQGNTWCERIPSVRRMQYQVMPRLLAISEIGWAQPEAKDWADFERRFVTQVDYLDRHGINYRVPDLTGFNDINVFVDTAVIEVGCLLPNIEVRYTTDGSFPGPESTLYTGPITVTESTGFIFRPFRPDGSAGAMQRAEYRKEAYLPAQTLPDRKLENGVRMIYHEFNGRRCADIEKAEVVRGYNLDSVSIPDKLEGWLGLVYEGYVEVPEDGIYTFALTSNDGSMLYVDGQLLIDNDGPHGDTRLTAQRALAKGWHRIRVEYFDMNNGGMLSLQWQRPGDETLHTLRGLKH